MFKSIFNFHRQNHKPILVISTLAVLLAHGLGIFLNLYDELSYYDSIVHFIGGLWVTTAGMVVFRISSPRQIIVFVFLIGIIWEFFEFILSQISMSLYKIPLNLQPSITDSLSDVLFDILGSFAAIFYSRSLKDSIN